MTYVNAEFLVMAQMEYNEDSLDELGMNGILKGSKWAGVSRSNYF